jgi:hypothetical protein
VPEASNLRTNPVLADRANGAVAAPAVLSALMMAPNIKMRMTPHRKAMTPPTKAPNKVMSTPYTLVTVATSALV